MISFKELLVPQPSLLRKINRVKVRKICEMVPANYHIHREVSGDVVEIAFSVGQIIQSITLKIGWAFVCAMSVGIKEISETPEEAYSDYQRHQD